MKIKKVKWKNHTILGDLEIDFMNSSSGVPFETILFAGENGTGKTTILENISTFLNRGSFEYFEYIEYIINWKNYKAIPSDHSVKDFYKMVDNNGIITNVHTNKSNNTHLIDTNTLDIRHYGCVYLQRPKL